jgi:thymidylate kinase
MSKKVFKVVVTGGPCAGKTTFLKHIVSVLKEKSIKVFTVPEISTLVQSNGGKYPGLDESKRTELFKYEINLLKAQIVLEEVFFDIANISDINSVVICDRGALDYEAYMPIQTWNELKDTLMLTKENLINRYDLVCHLVTAAEGAETFYTLQNNAVRDETPEEAREIDKKLRDCWSSHTKHSIFYNDCDFEMKMERVTEFIITNYLLFTVH